MVLILSNTTDASTNNVIDWLSYYKIKWCRINEDDRIEIVNLQIVHNSEPVINILVNGEEICLKNVTGYWYRRGLLYTYCPSIKTGNKLINKHMQHHVSNEMKYLTRFIYQYLAKYKKSVSNYLTAENDKLWYLQLASESGLAIPDSFICKRPAELALFQNIHNSVVTKSIHELISVQFDDFSLGSRTYLVDGKESIHNTEFFPSLFQNNIEKLFELRIFFLHEDLYPMAIFSQENEQTKVDFRNYDYVRPNRRVPYKLPELTEKGVRLFIEKSGFNSGSIDMIVTTKYEYIFLEINPIGQFGMVSYPCNYYLEKKIAKHFIV